MTQAAEFPCWIVTESEGGTAGSVRHLRQEDLPPVEGPSVLIEVEWSSLNYKDALACRGHRGVARRFPHVPGIDCAGRVAASDDASLAVGDRVLVTGYDLGTSRWGGFSGRVRVPADWPVPLPDGLTTRDAMTLGTAGFTAAQCVQAVSERVTPDAGDVLVTGATGGVGCLATTLLAQLGYRVVASTGKPDRAEALLRLGAAEVIDRDAVVGPTDKPLLSERWAAAVDTVGGEPLGAVLRATRHRGVVAACGLVAGTELSTSLYPFLLRGVTLAGIDSAKCPRGPRVAIWDRLATDWRPNLPEEWVSVVTLDGIEAAVERILAGQVAGRTLVRTLEDPAS